jgi:hypothetical protein
MRSLVMVLALVSALGIAGCVKKATYTSNGNGLYTLHAVTNSLDEAMERFQRTAADLCPEGSYEFGEPAADTSSPITYDIEMTCTPP